jgi:hypothetical protein
VPLTTLSGGTIRRRWLTLYGGSFTGRPMNRAGQYHIYIWCAYGISSSKVFKYTGRYGVYIQIFWPTLLMKQSVGVVGCNRHDAGRSNICTTYCCCPLILYRGLYGILILLATYSSSVTRWLLHGWQGGLSTRMCN